MPSLDGNFGIEAEDFKPIKRLGYGDMGTVILSSFHPTGQPFALKVMNKEIVQARSSDYRVDREADILSVLDHPFLPRLFAHFESKKHIYLVMDYCPGGDMNVLRRTQPEKRFSENAARFYAAEVVLAIEYLHKNGIIYRDLKPENVLIQEDGHIMLTDFDLSIKVKRAAGAEHQQVSKESAPKLSKGNSCKSIGGGRGPFMCGSAKSLDVVCTSHKAVDVKQSYRKTKRVFPSEKQRINHAGYADIKSQSFVGTEEYVAPEMILGCGHGMALDWWTFGIFLYEMLYGTTPFKGKNRRDTFTRILSGQPEFPGCAWTPASDLISKLLVKDSSKRLGFSRGAEEIKAHPFFQGVNWDTIQLVSRPPWVPPPLSLEEPVDGLLVDHLVKQAMPIRVSAAAAAAASDEIEMETQSETEQAEAEHQLQHQQQQLQLQVEDPLETKPALSSSSSNNNRRKSCSSSSRSSSSSSKFSEHGRQASLVLFAEF